MEAVFLIGNGQITHLEGPRGTTPECPEAKFKRAEVVRVRFDPARIGLADILLIFFATHDPTTRNRQGAAFNSKASDPCQAADIAAHVSGAVPVC